MSNVKYIILVCSAAV